MLFFISLEIYRVFGGRVEEGWTQIDPWLDEVSSGLGQTQEGTYLLDAGSSHPTKSRGRG